MTRVVANLFEASFLEKTVPELREGHWRLVASRLIEERRQGERHLAFGEITYQPTSGPQRTMAIVAKLYGTDPGARALAALTELWMAGFRPPSSARVPRPVGYSSVEAVLLQARVPGIAWVELITADRRIARAAAIGAAEWLLTLQAQSLGPIAAPPERSAGSARRHAAELALAYPSAAAALAILADRLHAALVVSDLRPVPAHGNFQPNNILRTADLTTVIDFDAYGPREPAYDVGFAIGQLLIASQLQHGNVETGARAAWDFWSHYHRRGAANWSRVAVQVARTYLQSLHYELCVARNARADLIDLWLLQAGEWLASDGPGYLYQLGGENGDRPRTTVMTGTGAD